MDTNTNRQKILSYIALGIGVLSLGTSAILIRLSNAPGPVTAFYRIGIAAAIMALPFLRKARQIKTLARSGIWMAVLGGLFFALDMASWSTGVVLSGATNPTLLANTAPVWVGVGAMIFFKEKLDARFWAGLALALAGAIIILGLDIRQAADFGLGSLFGLLAAFFYGGYFLFAQRGRETLDALSFWWIAAFSSSVVLYIMTVLLRQPLTGYPIQTYLAFLAMGLIPQIAGLLAINYALGHLPASIVSPTLLGQPVVTAILAGPILGESLSSTQGLGGLAVLLGVLVVHRSRS